MKKYDLTKNSYEENYKIFVEQWKDTNAIDNGKIEAFIQMIEPKSKILDIGAGFGKDVNYFCNKNFDCIGIDFCDNFIKESKNLYDNVTIHKMSFLEIDFPPNTFNALWSRGALFHLSKSDFKTVVKRLVDILKPNGIFYIQLIEGNYDDMTENIGNVESAAYYSSYTSDELIACMNECGFQYIKEYPVKGWLNHYYKLIK